MAPIKDKLFIENRYTPKAIPGSLPISSFCRSSTYLLHSRTLNPIQSKPIEARISEPIPFSIPGININSQRLIRPASATRHHLEIDLRLPNTASQSIDHYIKYKQNKGCLPHFIHTAIFKETSSDGAAKCTDLSTAKARAIQVTSAQSVHSTRQRQELSN